MWVSRKKWKYLQKKVADLEKEIQSQQPIIELLFEFCKSVAFKDKRDLFSYQQLNSPSTNSSEKVRMLLEQIRELG